MTSDGVQNHPWFPLAVALFVYISMTGAMLAAGLMSVGGELVYPLDDTYIHLSTARTLAGEGVWGAVPGEPSSPSSSILWTLLLAASGLLGLLGTWTPLVYNVVLSVAAVAFADRVLRRRFPALGWLGHALLLVALVAVASISVQTIVGMEHVLQVLMALVFVEAGIAAVEARRGSSDVGPALPTWSIWLAAPLLVATRYEGAFLVLPFCVLLAWHRDWLRGIGLGLVAMLPVGLFAAYSNAVGNYPLPNSIIIKADLLGVRSDVSTLEKAFANLTNTPVTGLFLVLALFIVSRHRGELRERAASPTVTAAVAVAMAIVLQMVLASTGWLFRYEAYLVAVGLVFVGPYAVDQLPDELAGATTARIGTVATWLLLALVASRGIAAGYDAVRSMKDRHLEHVLPTRFFAEHFPEATLMVNDLGLPAWLHTGPVLDVFGLGSNEPLEMRLDESGYTRDDVARWADKRGVQIAIHQIEWPFVARRLPHEWEIVSIWKVPRNVVFGDQLVAFFAVDPSVAPALRTRMQEYTDEHVPESVKVRIYEPGKRRFGDFVDEASQGGDPQRR